MGTWRSGSRAGEGGRGASGSAKAATGRADRAEAVEVRIGAWWQAQGQSPWAWWSPSAAHGPGASAAAVAHPSAPPPSSAHQGAQKLQTKATVRTAAHRRRLPRALSKGDRLRGEERQRAQGRRPPRRRSSEKLLIQREGRPLDQVAERGVGQTPTPPPKKGPKRYHGTVVLAPARVGRDADRIADEVIAHLVGLVGANVRVTLEIEA